jgi:hypothetical protein
MKVYIILAILFAMLIGTCIAQNATTVDVNTFKQALEKDGFTVREGGLTYFDFMKLYNARVLPSAYGNNPATKYLVYLVPPAPGLR